MENKVSSYQSAGVNRELADTFVDQIAVMAKKTLNRRVKSQVGGYASLYELNARQYLAASTDGVGTKLKIAIELGIHETVGVDLVAMSVNDLLCVGAQPLFFLDYFATGKLKPEIAQSVLKGIVAGCAQAECPLVGGETAEMPDFYPGGDYDLAGFAVGLVEKRRVLPSGKIKKGDVLLGLGSSGFHSNGYSLLRKWLGPPKENTDLAKELLTPTVIYQKALSPLLDGSGIKGLGHITGSGFLNVPRMSSKVSYDIQLPKLSELPRVFTWLRSQSLSFQEAAQTFNMGIGMVMVVDPKKSQSIQTHLRRRGVRSFELGEVMASRKGQSLVRVRGEDDEIAELKYS